MILFFEGYAYNTSLLRDYFDKHRECYQKVSKQSSCSQLVCVGYYHNADKGEHVYILPKVFLKSGKAFGEIELSAESGLVVQNSKSKNSLLSKAWQEDILYKLPVWLYSAIRKYYLKHQETSITEEDELLDVLSSRKDEKNLSLLDIALKVEDFYKKNENLFVFIYKESHRGYNKINWTKTIQKSTPIIKGKSVCYPSIVNRKKEVNYEEQLIVLFFNTLRYVRNNLIMDRQVETEYELYSDREFSRMMKGGMVARMLQNIKENYYNETLVELWNILYTFHKEFHTAGSGKAKDDYLLARKFNNVFEDMIDELIGDKLAANLKDQQDGKIIDHLFKHSSLTFDRDDIYYIGDSKYYKDGATPEGASRYKQYTYAKNIIQTAIDWYNSGADMKNLKYRDDLTEGYNITPNFFITGTVNSEDQYTKARLERSKDANGKEIEIEGMNQWPNRLFDRDTLFTIQYDINFLFVLYTYTSKNLALKKSVKNDAKDKFKESFTDYINDKYQFYVLKPKHNVDFESSLTQNFRLLIGKVFCPIVKKKNMIGYQPMMILALQDGAEENQTILDKLKYDFTIYDYSLGKNIFGELHINDINEVESLVADDFSIGDDVQPHYTTPKNYSLEERSNVIIGCYKSQEHLDWILKHQAYNVRWDEDAQGSAQKEKLKFQVKYLLLYDLTTPLKNLRLFSIKMANSKSIKPATDSIFNDYPGINSRREYLVYSIKEELSTQQIDIKDVEHTLTYNFPVGSPIYVPMSFII